MQAPDGAVSARAHPAQRPAETAADPAGSEARLQRTLKIVVIALAILLLAGLLAVIGRVIYLASSSSTQPAAPAVRLEQRLELPAGAVVRSVTLSENRLAVHYETGAGSGIAVLDLTTGRTITNVAIEPKLPGR